MALDKPLNLTFLQGNTYSNNIQSIDDLKQQVKELEKKINSKEKAYKDLIAFNELAVSGEASIALEWVSKAHKERYLTYLADSSGSDKGFSKHLYTTIYQEFIDPLKVKHLLEIGLLCHADQRALGGGNKFNKAPSLDMWCKYLPNTEIFGFDIQDFTEAEGCWKAFIQGDQSSRKDLAKILNLQNSFDVIIDDALHASKHQQITFSYLFKNVKSGGLYIIEDLHYQPFDESEELKTLDLLKALDWTGSWNSRHALDDEKEYIEKNIDEVMFFDSLKFPRLTSRDAICVIRKK